MSIQRNEHTFCNKFILFSIHDEFLLTSGKIQALKRSVPKGDKKRKKEVTEEIAVLEAKLKEKHNQENAEIVSVTSKIVGYLT